MFALSVFLKERLLARSTFAARSARIGRSADNDVHLDNVGVSRYHAAISHVGGVHVLEDFGGIAGTWVNGERVQGRRGLEDGDRIAIGKFLLVFRADAVTPPRPPITDEATHARAGETAELASSAVARERSHPFIAHVEVLEAGRERPPIHVIARDLTIAGAALGSDILMDARSAPPRAFAILRGWTGFSVLALAPGLTLNRSSVEGHLLLASRDELAVGPSRFRFLCAPRRGAP